MTCRFVYVKPMVFLLLVGGFLFCLGLFFWAEKGVLTAKYMQGGIDSSSPYTIGLNYRIDSHLEGMHIPDLLDLIC